MVLSPETRALYARAIENSAGLTAAELNRVFGRLPPEEEDEICRARVGTNRQAVISKAIAEPDTLSRAECDIVLRGPQYDSLDLSAVNAQLDAFIYLSPEELRLQSNAYAEVRRITDWQNTEASAYHNAYERSVSIHKQNRAEMKRKREKKMEGLRAAAELPRPKWIQDLLDAQLPRWGFVCFRTGYITNNDNEAAPSLDDAALDQLHGTLGNITNDNDEAAPVPDDASWDRLQWTFNDIAKIVLTHWWKRDGHLLYNTCKNVFISDRDLQGASNEDLRAWFRVLKDRDEIPEGVRRDCFLVADTGLLTSDYMARKYEFRGGDWVPYIKAVDADFNEAMGPLEGGFTGEITVPMPKVFDWLHYTLFTNCETWQERHQQTTQETWQHITTPYVPYPGYTGERDSFIKAGVYDP
ncbi:hypothetical protein EsH8_VI_000438 [Colletotrichum jinshuiense]